MTSLWSLVVSQFSHKGAPRYSQSPWKRLFGLHKQCKHTFIPVCLFVYSNGIYSVLTKTKNCTQVSWNSLQHWPLVLSARGAWLNVSIYLHEFCFLPLLSSIHSNCNLLFLFHCSIGSVSCFTQKVLHGRRKSEFYTDDASEPPGFFPAWACVHQPAFYSVLPLHSCNTLQFVVFCTFRLTPDIWLAR